MDKIINDMNLFLDSVCKGIENENLIQGYSRQIENEFVKCGYITIEDDGIFKKIRATPKGRQLYEAGGFIKENERKPIGFVV